MPKKEKSLSSVFMNGIIAENPTLRLVLGTCPTLATTTSATNAIGMGAAATIGLAGSKVVSSLLRARSPGAVRVAAWVAGRSSVVTMVQMFMQAFAHELYESLGMFIPLIVVNCIILARAEAFASKNGVAASAADGLGMGLGFTRAITVIGIIREIIGNGTVFGFNVLGAGYEPMLLMVLAPGGFLVFGGVLAVSNLITQRAEAKKKDEKGVIHA